MIRQSLDNIIIIIQPHTHVNVECTNAFNIFFYSNFKKNIDRPTNDNKIKKGNKMPLKC